MATGKVQGMSSSSLQDFANQMVAENAHKLDLIKTGRIF